MLPLSEIFILLHHMLSFMAHVAVRGREHPFACTQAITRRTGVSVVSAINDQQRREHALTQARRTDATPNRIFLTVHPLFRGKTHRLYSVLRFESRTFEACFAIRS